MGPVSDLSVLLKTLEPVLNPGVFVFASVEDGNAIDPAVIVASIREREGLSVVTSEADARVSGLNTLFKCAWITLTVNSALEAVGLTAAFATALGNAGISCNVVAGAYHDHIFVPPGISRRGDACTSSVADGWSHRATTGEYCLVSFGSNVKRTHVRRKPASERIDRPEWVGQRHLSAGTDLISLHLKGDSHESASRRPTTVIDEPFTQRQKWGGSETAGDSPQKPARECFQGCKTIGT
jgi:hypothetical protein